MQESGEHKELNALISMLDDPDNDVFNQIFSKILSYGLDAVPVLENAWENTFDGIIQQRIEDIVHRIQLDDLYAELYSWSHFGSDELLKGFILLSKFQYPDLDEGSLIKQIGRITQDVWLELNQNLTALEKIKVINHILYDINKFTGNKANINAPENYFLNSILESKKGNSISLGALFIMVAQGLKIPVFGVNLPRHFILAYSEEKIEKEKKVQREQKALFYINPLNKGALFTKKEIEHYVKQLSLPADGKYFTPCDNVTIIKRMIEELKGSYKNLGNKDKVEELEKLLEALLIE